MARTNGDTPLLPPHDLYAERALLGAMLLSYTAVTAATERLSADDYYRPSHGHVHAAILELYEDGDPIDAATVSGTLDRRGLLEAIGGPAELVTLQAQTPATSSAPKYADVIARLAEQRRMLVAVNDAAAALYDGNPDRAAVALDRARELAGRAAGDGRAFVPIDLAELLAGTPKPPALLTGWLYVGGFHIVQSEPGVGKSWLAQWQAITVMRDGGTVLYLDEEGGPEMVTERLRALGADPALVRDKLRYFAFEGRAWDAADAAALEAYLRELEREGHDPRLAVLDSLPDFLASAGVDENNAGEVTGFVARILGPLRKFGTAVVALDHLTKPPPGGQRGRAKNRYSRGSGAKLAKADATIHVETLTEFNRTTSGALKVWQAKDRNGALDLPSLALKPRVVAVNVDAATGRVVLSEREDDGTAPATDDDSVPTSCMELVSAWASREASAEGKPQKEALDSVPGFRVTTRRRALDLLVEHGYLTVTRGRHNAKLYRHAKLFHSDEPLGDRVADAQGATLEMF